jgi:hypothetical protein
VRGQGKKPLPAVREGPKDLVAISQSNRAVKVLLSWLRGLDAGRSDALEDACRKHRLPKRTLLRVLKKDPTIQEKVLGPQMEEIALAIQQGVTTASRVLEDPEAPLAERRMWLEVLLRLKGGKYERGEGGPNLLINLIPQLPPGMKEVEARVLDGKSDPDECLEDLLA